MPDIAALLEEIAEVPHSADPAVARAKSRDMYAVSPLLRKALRGREAEAVVSPRDNHELRAVLRWAVRHRIPLTPRGGGTANYGQSVPLAGGAMLDMTGYTGVVAVSDTTVRVRSGTLMGEIDEVLRAHGKELRIHPSTRSDSTIGGFIGGGSGGMGSCRWGMLRDPGNITAIQVISVEAEPRLEELRGVDTLLVQHAYGTNGVMTELELPLAPAESWKEAVVAFPDFMDAARFGIAFAAHPDIARKLASVQEWPVPRLMKNLGDIVPEGHSMAMVMVAARHLPEFRALVAMHGGQVVTCVAEGRGRYGAPLYEFAFGHALRQIQKHQPRYTVLQGMFPPQGLEASVARLQAAMRGVGPLRFEIFYSQGQLVGMGSPYVLFESEAQLAGLVDQLQAIGMNVANSHTTGVRAVGIKAIDERDAAFKRAMDPHGLLNPGKLGLEEKESAAVTTLATKGWATKRPAA